MQVRHLHKFSCEKSKSCRIIEHCYRPEVCYKDITKRHLRSLCHVDLYVFGFPCQNLSNLGRGQGAMVETGQLIMYSLAYIEAHKPTAIIIENVSTIPTKHRELLDFIETTLSSCGYTFQWKILNSLDFAVPQSRPRWYGVAILRTAKRTGDESFFQKHWNTRYLFLPLFNPFQRACGRCCLQMRTHWSMPMSSQHIESMRHVA